MTGKNIPGRKTLVLSLTLGIVLFGQQESPRELDEAAAAFEQGKTAEAESKLNSVLARQPLNLRALLLIGAVLDSSRRYIEAERYYQRALKIAPDSAPLLNNIGNHYLASGDRNQADAFFRKTVALDPQHSNANLQLARISVEEKQGRLALVHLDRLGDVDKAAPGVRELRARALVLTGQCSQAAEIAKSIEGELNADPRVHFSAGVIYAGCKLYAEAEAAFSRAMDADPRNFDLLYNLGLAALQAHHVERAIGVLELALSLRPDAPDSLFAVSRAYLAGQRTVDAAALLTKANRLAPDRSDILLMLAQVSAELEFYQDAADCYDRYLKLKPDDEVARRERGFALTRAGRNKMGLPDLAGYVRKHPRDAIGLYELAVAQIVDDPAGALQLLDRALTIDRRLMRARYTRAVLNIEEARPAASIADLRILLDQDPRNYHVPVRLGQAYLALNRAADAEEVLKRALNLAPEARSALVSYHEALTKLGRPREAEAVLQRLRRTAKSENNARPRTGLIDYLSLPPAEQRARYLANLRQNIAASPADSRLKIDLGTELLADKKIAEALEVFGEIRANTSDAGILGRCGTALLRFEQYAAARVFLQSAISADPSLSALRLDLATAVFRTDGGAPALAELDNTPEKERNGDYYLLRAQLLDSLGKVPEAAEALNRGMRAAPTRAGLYFQAASFLLKRRLNQEALSLLEQASRIVPDAPELLLAQWVTLNLLKDEARGRELLAKIQARWPEWDRPYLFNGILLAMRLDYAGARKALETAIALGTDTPEAHYYLAQVITQSSPEDLDAATKAIERALLLTSADPYIHLLAGKISISRLDYSTAIRHLLEAARLKPELIPAHYALRAAYKAMGDEQRAAAELDEIKRIGQESQAAEYNPFSVEDLLFTVRPPQ